MRIEEKRNDDGNWITIPKNKNYMTTATRNVILLYKSLTEFDNITHC